MYALTSAISSDVSIRFGIFGCELVRKARSAVAVIPGVFAISRNAGPISTVLGEASSGSTTWQALQTSRAKACPAAISPSWAFALKAIAAKMAASTGIRLALCIVSFGLATAFLAGSIRDIPFSGDNLTLRTATSPVQMRTKPHTFEVE